MRWIEKPDEVPPSIRDYLAAQGPVGHGFSYRTFSQTSVPGGGGTRGRQLCGELTSQQFGLCAYTGAGIDERLGSVPAPGKSLKFSAHNEHLKPQSVCKEELTMAGKAIDVDLGEDMDHRNIVAALLVSGDGTKRVASKNLFGAAHRENDPVLVKPTDPDCEKRFEFDALGKIDAANPGDTDALQTIKALNLSDETLTGWRMNAIQIFLEGIESREDAELAIRKLTHPENGRLPEYSFAIRQVVQLMIDLA
jgi:hypothetical protein